MDKLINFNMITFYIAMSKNAESENLADEIAVLPQALQQAAKSNNHAAILARLVRGLSPENWREIRQTYPLSHWHAFPVNEADYEDDFNNLSLMVSPFREVPGALTSGVFARLLKRELLRIDRNGGCLTLISAAVADKNRIAIALGKTTLAKLEDILGTILLEQLEECDTLGILKTGQYVCSLPGIGQLAARTIAEKYQASFADAARPFFPTGGISAGQGADCAIGIVNILQGERPSVQDLLRRAKSTLELALTKDGAFIYQETSLSPLDNAATLVQSNEMRFLFFGGDPS